MPFLEYHRLLQTAEPIPRTARGYNDELIFWDRLREIAEFSERYRIKNDRLRKFVLSAGPCPSDWRVYYSTVKHGEKYEPLNSKTYLGIRLPTKASTHELGNLFEEWVNEANHRFNSFVGSGNLSDLDTISADLGNYYRIRAQSLLNEATTEQRQSTAMDVSPEISLSTRPPVDMHPDGVFLMGRFGAVFESKISQPTYLEFAHEAAVYALACEKTRLVDINYAILLHSNYPQGTLASEFREVTDSAIDRVTANLEHFLRLLQSSEIRRFDNAGQGSQNKSLWGRIRGILNWLFGFRRTQFKSWAEFVLRPSGLPEQGLRVYCPTCPYQAVCYDEGGGHLGGGPNDG